VDWLIPEYWRGQNVSGSADSNDRLLMAALAHPTTLFSELAPGAGDYMRGNETTTPGDEAKTRYALEILRLHKPGFITLHLSSLDEAQHMHGPFSADSDATLEAIDGMVERLAKQEFVNDPQAVVVIISDHGFMNIANAINLAIPFLQAGLVEAGTNPATKAPTITSWKAEPWGAGGMAAIMLHNPNDAATEQQVRDMLAKLAANPDSGIAQVLDRAEIAKRGTYPDAAFLVVFKPGYYYGTNTSGELITPIPGGRGSHGFSPEYPEMRSSFFAMGAGIAHHRDLGIVDMRQIAPTVAGILRAPLATAKATPLHVEP
jgi:predicted AlkP superfamily pyrophosphatase or phosphodiesterase